VPHIEPFTLGPFETNCYVVTPAAASRGGPCWIVDASFEPAPIVEYTREHGFRPEALILTHGHVDHIAGVRDILGAFPGLPILAHEAELPMLANAILNLSEMMGQPVTTPEPARPLREGDSLTLGPDTWRILHTPGHSPGGITLYHEPSRQAIVGDALFYGSIGRTDFPGSDHGALVRAIQSRLYSLPDDTRVYSGHGPVTTIGREKRSNPFVRPA